MRTKKPENRSAKRVGRAVRRRPGPKSVTPTVIGSEGQRLLRALGKSLGELAAAVSCNRTSVHDWRNGEKTPVPEMRARLFAAYKIPPAAWDCVPTTPEPEPKGNSVPPADGALPTTLAHCDALLSAVLRMREQKGLRPADVTRLASTETRILALRSQLEEKAELLEDRIVREHPAWQRLKRMLVRVLMSHPHVAREVADAIAAEGM